MGQGSMHTLLTLTVSHRDVGPFCMETQQVMLPHLQVVCCCGRGLHGSSLQRCRIVVVIAVCSNGTIQGLYLHATAHPFSHLKCTGLIKRLLSRHRYHDMLRCLSATTEAILTQSARTG